MATNPYNAYVKISLGATTIYSRSGDTDLGAYNVDGSDNGTVSLQAVFESNATCHFTIEVYDDTANKFAEAILERTGSHRKLDIEYGYPDGEEVRAMSCMITKVRTELVGTGEILIIECVSEALDKVINNSNTEKERKRKYTGKPSDIVREVIKEIGWKEGKISETDDLRGENNGNDDLLNPEDYAYWDYSMNAVEFMKSLETKAVGLDGSGDFKLHVDYGTQIGDIPVVSFCPSKETGEDKQITFIYGDPDSEVVSLNVDWGNALLASAGAAGITANNQDSITNLALDGSQTAGVASGQASSAKYTGSAEAYKAFTGTYGDDDLEWLSRVIYAEVGTESEEIQMKVGSVVLNRLNSNVGSYKDLHSVKDVIFQGDGKQYDVCNFSKYGNNAPITKTPSEQSVNVARQLLANGSVLPSNVLGQTGFDVKYSGWSEYEEYRATNGSRIVFSQYNGK